MSRFFTQQIEGNTARITGEDVRHLSRVLRLRVGDAVEICDGACTDYTGLIEAITEQEVRCALSGAHPSPTEPRCRVTLFQALPKTGKLELIVQKCVELGVDTVVPVVTARCVAVPVRDFEFKRVRYQRVASEAAKQSRRGMIPQVASVRKLSEVSFSGFDAVLVAYEEERARSLKAALRAFEPAALSRIALVVGPEGGLERAEVEGLSAAGAVAVSLGARILRTETAGMAMLAQVLYELDMADA